MRIAICDVGVGNLRSVERAISSVLDPHKHASITITDDADVVRGADKIVVPGQGAFRDCARALDRGLGDAIREQIARGKPYLGICLGLQVLFGSSEEAPGCAGLGVLEGEVIKLAGGVDPTTGGPLKIPHVGWNTAEPSASRGLLPDAPRFFYFVHSYVVVPKDPNVVAATTEYGTRFVSAVAKDNVFACQFHPEKSQRAGLELLGRFVGQ